MKRSVKTSLFIVWAVFCIVALGLIQDRPSLTLTAADRWIITHVIDPSDPASYGVLTYLKDCKATPQYDELIIFTEVADIELIKSLKKRGFTVEYKKESELHLEETALKLPFFLLTSPHGEGVFTGPYDFPMSGCGGMTARIQKRIDPQGTLASLVFNFKQH